MADFAFQIVGDASKAEQAISSVEKRLADIGASAVAVNLKMRDALGGGNDNVARAAASARKALGEQNDQLKRQADLLSRIHGPAKSLASDLQALDALYRRNAISLSEYANEYRRLQDEFARSSGAKPNVPAAPSAIGLGSLRGAATAVGIGVGVKEVGELANEYQNLQNRLRFLAGGDMPKVNALFRQTQQVAAETRSDLSSTTEALVRFTLATKNLGLSQGEVFALTERINKAIKLSGASSAEASAGLIQLSQGLASGALRGDELRSVLEQLPAVADVIAKGLGVTRGQLRQLGADGKITADVIVDAFKKAGPELDKAFGDTVPTLAESLVQLKNNATVAFGSLVENTGIATAFGAAIKVVGDGVSAVTSLFELLEGTMHGLGPTLAAGTAALVAWKAGVLASLGPVAAIVAGLEAAKYIGDKLSETFNADIVAARKMNEQLAAAYEAFNAQTEAVIKDLDAIHDDIIAHETLGEALSSVAKEAASTGISFDTVGDVVDVLTTKLGQLFSQVDRGRQILIDANKDWDAASAKADDYKTAIITLKAQIEEFQRISGSTDVKKFLSSGDIATIRAYADAQQDATDLAQSYGIVIQQIHKQERDRRRAIEDLNDALAAGAITQDQFNEAIKRYSPEAKKAAKDAEKLAKEYEKIARAIGLVSEGPKHLTQAEQYKIYLEDIKRADQAEEEAQDRAVKRAEEAAEEKIRAHKEWRDSVLKYTDEAAEKRRDFEEKEKQAALKYAEQLGQTFAPLKDALVDMFRTGELSGERFLQVLDDIAIKLIEMQVLAAIDPTGKGTSLGQSFARSLLGAANGGQWTGVPRYDSGGQGMVGGNYGLDNNLFVARVSRDERVTIETPEDQRTGKYFGGGRGGTVINKVVYIDDPRQVVSSLDTRAGRTKVVKINRRFRRAR